MELVFKTSAYRQFKKLTPQIKEQVSQSIREFESTIEGFDQYSKMKLKGYKDRYKIRSGSYRIIVRSTSNTNGEITAIADRKSVYKKIFEITL